MSCCTTGSGSNSSNNGGILALVAKGHQDVFMTDSPEITYFRQTYKRHTNFAMCTLTKIMDTSANFGTTSECVLPRTGDLVHKAYLQIEIPKLGAGYKWVENLGHSLINWIEVHIGGHKVDHHSGEWLEIYKQLHTRSFNIEQCYDNMLGNLTQLNEGYDEKECMILYVPLRFWFNRFVSQCLPLISLQYHEVKIVVNFRKLSELVISENCTEPDCCVKLKSVNLLLEYMYLDTDERRRFATKPYNILLEQIQQQSFNIHLNKFNNLSLNLNNNVKALIWTVQPSKNINDKNYFLYTRDDISLMKSASIQLNGTDFVTGLPSNYFGLVQPYERFTSVPNTGVFVYSFCLAPHEAQPSGTVNFSRINTATLKIDITDNFLAQDISEYAIVNVYAITYNVLTIKNGMAGIKYTS